MAFLCDFNVHSNGSISWESTVVWNISIKVCWLNDINFSLNNKLQELQATVQNSIWINWWHWQIESSLPWLSYVSSLPELGNNTAGAGARACRTTTVAGDQWLCQQSHNFNVNKSKTRQVNTVSWMLKKCLKSAPDGSNLSIYCWKVNFKLK